MCPSPHQKTDDLALRHAASQALSRFVEGVAAAAADSGDAGEPPEGGSLLSAAQRVLFPQLKRGLSAAALAVRQEHLALLRQLVRSFPSCYPDLVQLTGGWAFGGGLSWQTRAAWTAQVLLLARLLVCRRMRARLPGLHLLAAQGLRAQPMQFLVLSTRTSTHTHTHHTLMRADADAEVDFLLNVAHIQLHRRARCAPAA